MSIKIRIPSLIFCIFMFPLILIAQQKQKKLIEYGWDYPTVSDLKNNISKIETAPFEGVCFSVDKNILNAFDNIAYSDSRFQNLSGIQWKKFTDNFLIVRGASQSGAHWLDDNSWNIISQNLQKISKAASLTGAVGIGFDAEYYFKDSTLNPWIYKPQYYNNLSYDQVGEYVRKRGKQFVEALQTSKSDIKILCFWLLGQVNDQVRTKPVEKTYMALYPFFIEGMLEGKSNPSEIIDGNESSYWYQSFIPFVTVGGFIRGNQSNLIGKNFRDDYKKISVAESIYLDGLYALSPRFEKGLDKQTKTRWLKDNLYFAYKTTDEYVWLYDENVNWWQNQVDAGVADIINDVKKQINGELSNINSSVVNGQSKSFDFKKVDPDNYSGFSFNYQKNQNQLGLNITDNKINNIQVYKNSMLIYNQDNPSSQLSINLNGKYDGNGNLIVISKNNNKIYSVAFIN